ncbi:MULTISPECIES: sulfate/molybdate ABC transporter ATP-binding protein [Burkholderia]|jgi:sulfate transport system ATP-binding protein|uniref:Sulfate transport system ATP-binding protein n=3 Tax=Burkholderia multivorans TaxID=87883 RepID=A0A0H3KEU5_BURM1|nr:MULTISPECIES: sulfate ABC transporter ATP-binding protein [Burkholderia]ABX15321.1 sulfate ABC transporter, ATPase subunit [Burkholderia multivorans ATCC 17616]AIO76562.1 sulfate ABC transporter, ATP-binding family protein [Burkholderia multivorans]AJY18702.1 sulfate ABC transporter, ATP-binding family protein [Burkholderia multivorans ATCC BAA-247]AOK67520.1 sulfate ABC transporter ATP-binding protein [Burkholderia multivorans]AVR22069.1 sulfate ABC transporter ATP-binding protein [Burkhol
MGITVRHLQKRFGDFTALDNVSLDFPPGELVALLGPSGCGKTTLLRVIAGLEHADAGQVVLQGLDVASVGARDRQVGFVFQHYALFRHMTVFENVAFGLRVKPRRERPSEAAIRDKVHELLKLVQLDWLAQRYPSELSGGQRQRIALARALAVEPKVLLLDEPFGALDAKVRKELRGWLRRLHDDLHISTIFVTHDQEEALEVADRIVVLNRGRVEQVGSPQEVYDHPQSAFVYEFLGAANRLPGTVAERGFVAEGAAAPIAVDADFAGPAHAYVRPHDLQLWPAAEAGHRDGIAVDVRRVIPLGGSVRVELESRAGGALEAELDRDAWRALSLQVGDGATAVPRAVRVFPAR